MAFQWHKHNSRLLQQIIKSCYLVILNDTTPTRYVLNGNSNVLDLALATNYTVPHSQCYVIPYSCGIDYRTVQVNISSITQHKKRFLINNYNNLSNSLSKPQKFTTLPLKPTGSSLLYKQSKFKIVICLHQRVQKMKQAHSSFS